MKKLFLILFLVFSFVAATAFNGFSQCSSTICTKEGACVSNTPPYGRSGCLTGYACLVSVGVCSNNNSRFCFTRTCIQPKYCPPNPNSPTTISNNGVHVGYTNAGDWVPSIGQD